MKTASLQESSTKISGAAILAIAILPVALLLAGSAQAQRPPGDRGEPAPSWKREFGEVKVERIRPADLPKPEESKFPTVLQSATVLPRAPTVDALQAGARGVAARVVEVVALHMPAPPIRQSPIALRGHAVWMSAEAEGSRPVLVSAHHWLDGAKMVFLMPPDVESSDAQARADGLPTAERRSIDSLTAGGLDIEALLARKDELVPLAPSQPDTHRNLVTLVAANPERPLEAPKRGLTFFPLEGQSPTRIYGYSPRAGSGRLSETTIAATPPDEATLIYYLQSNYGAALGAPIVTVDGELVGITAMRHPEEGERTLVIPPGALRVYVEGVQGLDDRGVRETIGDPDRPDGDSAPDARE